MNPTNRVLKTGFFSCTMRSKRQLLQTMVDINTIKLIGKVRYFFLIALAANYGEFPIWIIGIYRYDPRILKLADCLRHDGDI